MDLSDEGKHLSADSWIRIIRSAFKDVPDHRNGHDMPTQTRFYYPDTSVICRPNPDNDSFQDEPVVIVEVISRKTRRIDEGEKKDAYLTIPSLNVYMLIEQDSPVVRAFRRTDAGFAAETYQGLDAVILLAEINTSLPLEEIYEGIEFVLEPSDDDDGEDG